MIRSFAPSSRFALSFVAAASLSLLILSACGQDDECTQDSCFGGTPSSGGTKMSSGGRSSAGGSVSSGGRRGEGTGGGAGESPVSSGGSAGAVNEGSGGATVEEPGPRVTRVVLDGQQVDSGDTLRGVREGATVKVTFSRPMDTLSVEEAFVARSEESALSSFIIGWNERDTELSLILRNRIRYEEVTMVSGKPRELGFLLTKRAKDTEGHALEEEFFVTFSLLRRWTQFTAPDLTNSALAYGNVPSEQRPTEYLVPIEPFQDACPWLNPENEHNGYLEDTFRQEFPYTPVANYAATPGRHGKVPRGTRIALYSFPLTGLPTGGLESATLKLAKSMRLRVDTSDQDEDGSVTDFIPYYSNPPSVDELPFSVDALASFSIPPSPTSSAAEAVFSVSSLRPNLENSLGEEYSKGFGFFEFDVTELVENGIDAGDTWAMYRADFDGLPVIQDDPITVCVTMGLETVALVE